MARSLRVSRGLAYDPQTVPSKADENDRRWPRRVVEVTAFGTVIGAVVVSFVLVGAWASPEDAFEWELASIFGTAVGTTLLALGTGWLAYSTRSEVRATQELAELTRRDQIARERPIVLVQALTFRRESDTLAVLDVNLANVGLGPALRVRIEGSYVGEDVNLDVLPGTIPVIAAGDWSGPRLQVNGLIPGDASIQSFTVSGSYQDRSRDEEYPIIAEWLEE